MESTTITFPSGMLPDDGWTSDSNELFELYYQIIKTEGLELVFKIRTAPH